MKRIKIRILPMLLAVCILLGLMPVFPVQTQAADGFTNGTSGEFVIAANVDGTYYAMTTTFAKKVESKVINVNDGYVPEADAEGCTVTLAYTGSGYTISNGSYYLGYSSSTNLSSTSTAYTWNLSAGTHGTWRLTASGDATRGLVFRGKNYNQFGAYAVSNATATSAEYYDIEILPVGTFSGATEEVFARVTSAADLTAGRYVILFVSPASDFGYSHYALYKQEDSGYYGINVVGANLSSLPSTITASEGLVWNITKSGSSLVIGTGDGSFLYNDSANPTRLELKTDSSSKWTATYNSTAGGFYLKSTNYLSVFEDSEKEVVDSNGLPIAVCLSSTTDSGGIAVVHLYKSQTVTQCTHANKQTTTTPATCTATGIKIVTCSDCGAEISRETLAATGHSYSGGTCTNCGATDPNANYSENFGRITSVNQLTTGEYVLMVVPGGKNPGNYAQYVMRREMYSTSYVMATGYNLSAIPASMDITDTALVWNLTVETNGVILSGSDDLTLNNTNNYLYYNENAATTWTAAAENGLFTFSANGRYLGLRDDLTTVDANGNPVFRCNSSASTSSYRFYLFKKGATGCIHENTETTEVPAGCTTTGTRTVICKDCGITVSDEVLPVAGHNPTYKEGVPAGCTTEGTAPHFVCQVCGSMFTDPTCSNGVKPAGVVVKPLGHDMQEVNALQPTCGTDGMAKHYHCEPCGGYFTDAEGKNEVTLTSLTIPALGHDTVHTPGTPATCIADGNIDFYTCSICDLIFSDEACTNQVTLEQTILVSPDHEMEYYPVVEATCTTTGTYAHYYCPECHIYYSNIECTEVITEDDLVAPALGHKMAYTSRIEPGCEDEGIIAHYYCETCGLLSTDAEGKNELSKTEILIAATGHSFANGVCTACGLTTTATVDSNITILHTLDLASDISISFVVAATALESYDSYYLECVIPEFKGNEQVGTSTVQIQPVLKGKYYYFTLTGLTALRMGDTVEATVHMTKDGLNYVSNVDKYSVATYAYGMLEKSTDEKMLSLCANLLRYGAEAQTYKNYRTDALVDAAMTDAQRAYITDLSSMSVTETDRVSQQVSDPFVTWVGKTLLLDSKVGVKFVFSTANYSGDVSGLSMRVSYQNYNGETKTATLTGAETYSAANKMYSFTFSGLLAAELRSVLTVAIYEGDMQLSDTLQYSMETYAAKTTGTTLGTLSRAVLAYSDAAKAYFTK